MKTLIATLMLAFSAGACLAQPVVFEQRNDLLQPITGFTEYSDCVVDMNGDYLDDVVRVGGKGLFIDYQQADGSFIQRQFNFSLQSLPSWSICAGDLDNNTYNDLLFGHSSSVSFIKADSNALSYDEILMPDFVESQRSNMADINNDGWLDAFVCNESGENSPYRNLGNGIMIYDSTLTPTANTVGNYASIWTDYDNDGDIDLYISKCWESALPGDSVRTNLLYQNNGDGTYTETGAQAQMDDNAQTWSTAFEDFDNDGDFDAFIANHDFANRLMRNNGDGTFTDVIMSSGIDPLDLIGYETLTGDFNNDGNMDLFTDLTVNLYLGNGNMTFTGYSVPVIPGGIGDLNDDGFLDVMYRNQLWMNTGNDNHWVKINTVGIVSNHNGIGARIEVYGVWGRQVREVRSGVGYSPMNSLTTHVGIGQAVHIDSIIVRWPSGIVTTLRDLDVDTTYNIPENECVLPAIQLDVTDIIRICPWESIPLEGPVGYAAYQWSHGDTSRFTVIRNEGTYFLIATDSAGCISISDLVKVEVFDDIPPSITSDHSRRICEGDTIELTSSPGENYQWSTGEILMQTIQVSEGGTYSVSVDARCFDGQISSDGFEVIMLDAPPPVISDVQISPGDSILLIASGENIHWYDEEGMLINTGSSFHTPPLSSSTTYFIESHYTYPAMQQTGGKLNISGEGDLESQNGSLLFEAWEEFIIDSVTVYIPPGGPEGLRFIQLISEGNIIASASFQVHAGFNSLPLNFYVPVGQYSIISPQGNLFRNAGPLNYPYPIGDVGQITGSSNGDFYYYYFYDWRITKPSVECVSDRVPVNIIVSSNEVISETEFMKIFPNPVRELLFVKFDTPFYKWKYSLANSFGVEIAAGSVMDTNYMLDVSGIPAGIYILRLTGKDLLYSKKIIKL